MEDDMEGSDGVVPGDGDRDRLPDDSGNVPGGAPGDVAAHRPGAGAGGAPMVDTTAASADRTGPTPALIALVAVAVVVLVIGLIVWLANRGDDDIASAPVTLPPVAVTSTTPDTSLPATTSTSSSTSTSTTSTTTTSSTTTSTTPSTTTTTSTPPTTAPPAFALPDPGASSWTVALQTGQQVTLGLTATADDVAVYDGVVDGMRCVGIVGPGDDLTSWCGEPGAATTLVADRSLEPLLVDLGPETVTVTAAPVGWTAAANGCSTPLATILAAVDPGAHAVTDVICAGNEAFVGHGSSLFGPDLAPDGGGILVGAGDEGWNPIGGFGTSIDCADWHDGVDRCALFDVEFELFEALLPIPSPGVIGESALQVVDLIDVAPEVETWIGDTTDPDEIASIVADELVDPDAEVPASVRRSDPLRFGTVELVLVEIPQLDDAGRFRSWAVWTGLTESNSGVVAAFSWATCARGVTGDGLCV